MPLASLPLLRRAQYRAEDAGVAAMEALIHALGPDRASAVSGRMWRIFAPFNPRHARADGHLARSLPESGPEARAGMLNRMWDNLGRTTAEACHLETLARDLDRFEIDEEAREAVRRSKAGGAVFVSLHQGNWELAVPLLGRLGLPAAGVYQRVRNPLVDARATRARAPSYPLGLFPKGQDSARRLLRIIGEGGTVAIMSDLRDLEGVAVPFFGRLAPSTPFPAVLARMRNVPVFAGAVLRREGATFRVRVREVAVARGGERDADIAATTANIQAMFETFVREAPEQWMWGHKRWER